MMDNMAIFIDVSKCTACRACQVACKSWNQLKAEQTRNRGSHENPPDLSPHTWNRIRYIEQIKDGRISWKFFSDRCRHCDPPDCKYMADTYVEGAIIKEDSGAVVFTEKIKQIDPQEILSSCPYNIPRYDPETNMVYKCNFCIERISAGLPPACAKVCSTGAITFGKKEDMLKLANARLNQLSGDATLYPGEGYNTLWVLPQKELLKYI
jgi:formate dehydrogenase iron-sulfur subunit